MIDAASGLVTWIVVPYAAEPGRTGDDGAVALEEVRRRVDLGAEASAGFAAADDDAAVGEQDRGRVVHPGLAHRLDGRPLLGRRVPDLAREDGRGLAVAGCGAADRHHGRRRPAASGSSGDAAKAIGSIARHDGFATFMSTTIAVLIDGSPPPARRILPGRYWTADSE